MIVVTACGTHWSALSSRSCSYSSLRRNEWRRKGERDITEELFHYQHIFPSDARRILNRYYFRGQKKRLTVFKKKSNCFPFPPVNRSIACHLKKGVCARQSSPFNVGIWCFKYLLHHLGLKGRVEDGMHTEHRGQGGGGAQ